MIKLEGADSDDPGTSTSTAILDGHQRLQRCFNSKKRRAAGRRKRKLLTIRAKERINCPQCYRRFSHLKDLAKHLARRIHGRQPFITGAGKKSGKKVGTINNPSTSTSAAAIGTMVYAPRRRSTRLQFPGTGVASSSGGIMPKTSVSYCPCPGGGPGGILNCFLRKINKRKRPPHCTICKRPFVCVTQLRQHLNEKHGFRVHKPPKMCPACGATFATGKALDHHLLAAQ